MVSPWLDRVPDNVRADKDRVAVELLLRAKTSVKRYSGDFHESYSAANLVCINGEH